MKLFKSKIKKLSIFLQIHNNTNLQNEISLRNSESNTGFIPSKTMRQYRFEITPFLCRQFDIIIYLTK